MKLPDFFDRVPRLRVRDPLAALLGCADDGILDYGYADVVRLTGHSCPSVAGAYWLTYRALAALYPAPEIPERGGVRVEFRENPRDGVNGVVAAVVQLLTGAAGESGFCGFAGRHARVGLQRFAPELPMALRFTRVDTGVAVDAHVDLGLLPQNAGEPALLARCLAARATPPEMRLLGQYWQQRVRTLLFELGDDPGVFVVRPASHHWGTPSAPPPPQPSALGRSARALRAAPGPTLQLVAAAQAA
ncbi:MAG: hypothetical protein ABIP61_08840 [Burkholderiaceae bacterium]